MAQEDELLLREDALSVAKDELASAGADDGDAWREAVHRMRSQRDKALARAKRARADHRFWTGETERCSLRAVRLVKALGEWGGVGDGAMPYLMMKRAFSEQRVETELEMAAKAERAEMAKKAVREAMRNLEQVSLDIQARKQQHSPSETNVPAD